MSIPSITPIFIFSLPRSGSTLLQRILASHNAVATTSEPWILLPLLYAKIEKGAFAEYGHRASAEAVNDFIKELPDTQEYTRALRELTLRLYSSAAHKKPGSQYFLDKTPRYHLIADLIIEMFPDARFIFLWRNPLAIVASIIETFGRGKWQLYDYKVDLFDGLSNLVDCYQQHSKQVLSVRFEDLISSPVSQCNKILGYLELPADSIAVSSFSKVSLKGNMGDATGQKLYKEIDTKPIDKWTKTLTNPLRRNWTKRYLRWIGRERLSVIGYDFDLLSDELHGLPYSLDKLGSDSLRILYGVMQCAFEARIIGLKTGKPRIWRDIHGHT